MEQKELSMSDPISPIGSQGQVPQVATPSRPTPAQGSFRLPDGATFSGSIVAAAVTASVKAPTGAATAASSLDLSAAATAKVTRGLTSPKAMDVADAAKSFQDYLKNLPSDLQFQPDASTGIVVFKVVNPITQEVLRQYPPEEMLAMARTIKEGLKKDPSGIILDQQL